MNNTFPFSGPGSNDGANNFGSLFGGANGPAGGIFEAMDQLRKTFEQRPSGGSRMAKGDVRTAVLSLLTEKPMHGYQIINEIAERSGGSWKPSAGSVYPTLQLLADEGLISAEEQNGRKTYSLTEAGRAVAAEATGTRAPWESSDKDGHRNDPRFSALPKAGVDLAAAAAQVGRSGSPEQVQSAVDVLDDARRKLYSILAQD
ncbi:MULTISPECIES: PadR family transcriptional regulator [unclassified Microbacterium]|uniref:PadR family transcriptional regulator n=1 Tax=unclassified Microbacterium TaxID=2609290 RepID=UPI000EAA299D|nr:MULTISPECIES: PadR family transcriptional regulator [unclassified Microbacterium]MBT2484312.1 PadR family transcriptional regulator [Microbacterium sp. ISL-108]RKN67229.1 PadR family transcriptional regulator [Microbacterium sp. CGR2]